MQEFAVVGRDRSERNAAGNEVLTERQHDGLRTFTGACRDEWGRRDVHDATVSLQTGFRQQRRVASGCRSENRKPYLPVAVAGGHLRRRSLSLFGLTPGLGLAPVQFELYGSYQVSEFLFFPTFFSVSKMSVRFVYLSANCVNLIIKFNYLVVLSLIVLH